MTEGWGENCFSSLAKNVENKGIPMYILQTAELLQAEALRAVTEGWGERSTDSMWVDQEWWMVERGESNTI